MANSFRKIDYRLRPAKAVERRMMAETFLRLRPFGAVESYRYVGLGSVYFSDFSLFHSLCGFQSMVSIEGTDDAVVQERFRLNIPLGSISMLFGHSNVVLPKLEWDRKSVVWMDYDGGLDAAVLADVKYLTSKIKSGSILAISVNGDLIDREEGTRSSLQVLTDRLGSTDKIPTEISTLGHLPGPRVYETYRSILSQELTDALNDRNAGRIDGERYKAQQLLYFRYTDGAPMFTLAWVFYEEGQEDTLASCGFNRLSFAKDGNESFNIQIPLLTSVEMRLLNRRTGIFAASNQDGAAAGPPLPPSELLKFNAVRRYWPPTASELV